MASGAGDEVTKRHSMRLDKKMSFCCPIQSGTCISVTQMAVIYATLAFARTLTQISLLHLKSIWGPSNPFITSGPSNQ